MISLTFLWLPGFKLIVRLKTPLKLELRVFSQPVNRDKQIKNKLVNYFIFVFLKSFIKV